MHIKKLIITFISFSFLLLPFVAFGQTNAAQDASQVNDKLKQMLISGMKSNSLESVVSTAMETYSLDSIIHAMNEIEETTKESKDPEILGYTLKEVDHTAVAKTALNKGTKLVNVYIAFAKEKNDQTTSDILLTSGVTPKFVIRTMRELCIPNIDQIGREIGVSIADIAAGKVMAQDVQCGEELGYTFVNAAGIRVEYKEPDKPASPYSF